jgi:hypothetical protein
VEYAAKDALFSLMVYKRMIVRPVIPESIPEFQKIRPDEYGVSKTQKRKAEQSLKKNKKRKSASG